MLSNSSDTDLREAKHMIDTHGIMEHNNDTILSFST
jgi:hypothetical protein